jgi:hypothetical protein
MNDLIPGNVYRNKDIPNANKLYQELKIFPTPFKGIYYIPYESEMNGHYISDPHPVLFRAAQIYLKTDDCYFGLYSALYYNHVIWNAVGVDIVNARLSRKIIRKLPSKNYWRGQTINSIMTGYPFPLRFHKVMNVNLKGTLKKGAVIFSDIEKTRTDAAYLCRKGDKTACEVLKLIGKK